MSRETQPQLVTPIIPMLVGVAMLVGVIVINQAASELQHQTVQGKIVCNGFGGCNGFAGIEYAALLLVGVALVVVKLWGEEET